METKRYDLPVAVGLRLQSRSGKVHVIAERRDDVEAETDALESFADDRGRTLLIRSSRGGSKTLTVRVPIETDVSVGTQSGSVTLEGRLGSIAVTTISGNIDVEDADEADVRSMSGSVSVGTVRGRCRCNSVSGSLSIGEAESTRASTISGSIKLRRIRGDVKARSVSGSVEMQASGDSPIAVKTVSGKVRIELPEGTEPALHVKTHGHVRCDFERGRDCRIEAASLSGSIDVVPPPGAGT